MQSNFIETTLRHGCSPVNLLHIFRTPFHIRAAQEGSFCHNETESGPIRMSMMFFIAFTRVAMTVTKKTRV